MDMNAYIRAAAGRGPALTRELSTPTTPRIPPGNAGSGCGLPAPVGEARNARANRWLRRGMLWVLYGEHEIELGGGRW